MTDKLKPCPFCNAKSTNGGEYPDKIGVVECPETHNYTVICLACGVSTDYFSSKTKAIKAWNRRADNDR